MKRRRWVIVSLVVLASVAIVVFWPRSPRPCRATFEQVREGMTQDEVIATVGGPPGNHSSDPDPFVILGSGFGNAIRLIEHWSADDGTLYVSFDADGAADVVWISEPPAGTRNGLQRLRAWLGL